MEKESLPQWGWLLIVLMIAAIASSIVNSLLGVSEAWQIVITITFMAPVLIYVGVWYEEDRQHYWEHSRAKIAGDAAFLIIGAGIGAGIAVAGTIDLIGSRFARDIVAMLVGFISGWALFWWRNPDLYRPTE